MHSQSFYNHRSVLYLINFVYKIQSDLADFAYQDNCMLRQLIRKLTCSLRIPNNWQIHKNVIILH